MSDRPPAGDPRPRGGDLTMDGPWDQRGYRRRLEWGRRGARLAAERGDVLVVVDVLSFSTAAATAIAHGGIVCPCAWDDDPAALAARVGAEVAVRRRSRPRRRPRS